MIPPETLGGKAQQRVVKLHPEPPAAVARHTHEALFVAPLGRVGLGPVLGLDAPEGGELGEHQPDFRS
jgi:hypothetical protein